jgi:hypothetical protein
LGAFEYGLEPPPTLNLTQTGQNLDFSGGGGPAGGTNYLVSTTNLALPPSQWSRVTTNKFDLAGNYAITNVMPPTVPQQFYHIRLQ